VKMGKLGEGGTGALQGTLSFGGPNNNRQSSGMTMSDPTAWKATCKRMTRELDREVAAARQPRFTQQQIARARGTLSDGQFLALCRQVVADHAAS